MGDSMKALISDYPITLDIPIAWGDMDAFEHVNNVMYFKYFESARIAYFEALNYFEVMNKTGLGPILAATQCSYKIPLTYPDQVTAGARVDQLEDDRFLMKYVVVSHAHKKIAALGEGMLVSFDYHNSKKAPLPDDIRENIIALEKRVGNAI